jgi:site-specific DNA recombinase
MTPTQAIIYTRISPNPKTRADAKAQRLSPSMDLQLDVCRKHAARKAYDIIGEYSDPAISGKDSIESRPGLQSVLSVCQKTEVVVIVYSLSRLSRRQSLTWALLDERGEYALKLESATEAFDTSTAMGRAMLGMMGVWAQLEADQLSERMIAALQARKDKGLPLGPKPLSVTAPGIVEQVKALYCTGQYSMATLAEHLNQTGVPTSRGKKWHSTQVCRVLRQAV